MLMFSLGLFGLKAQTYESMWKAVEKASDEGKPRSAIEVLEKISSKAKKEGDFLNEIMSDFSLLEANSSIDSEYFHGGWRALEEKYQKVKDPADKAVLHALLGSACDEMRYARYYRYDGESKENFQLKKEEHFSHIFDDMEVLLDTDSKKYKPLIKIQKDGSVYNHTLLAVLVGFADENSVYGYSKKQDIHKQAAELYASKGNTEAEILMLLPLLDSETELYDMLMKSRDLSVGMDVAYKYYNEMSYTVKTPREWTKEGWESDDRKLKFSRWARTNVKMSDAWDNIENRIKDLMKERVTVTCDDEVIFANQDINLSVSYYNTKSVHFKVRKYNGLRKEKGSSVLSTDGDVVGEYSLAFGDDDINKAREKDELPVRGKAKMKIKLPAGHYVIVADGAKDDAITEFKITTIRMVSESITNDMATVYVLDNETGRPVKGATVIASAYEKPNLATYTTNSQGKAYVSTKGVHSVRAIRSEGDESPEMYLSSTYPNYVRNNAATFIDVFSDRSIYRPGHVVKGNVLAYYKEGDKVTASANESLRLAIYDPEGKQIANQNLKANAYGTADFEFQMPDDAKLGSYRIAAAVQGASTEHFTNISVEEYKRPTFDVSFDTESDTVQNYSLGQTVQVKGKAIMFNGTPVQGAKVKCTISWGNCPYWRYYCTEWEKGKEIELTTDDDGFFSTDVLLDDKAIVSKYGSYYGVGLCKLDAIVTDQSGESHEATWSIRLSRSEFGLFTDVPEVLSQASQSTILFHAVNAKGDKVDVKGTYKLSLKDSDVVAEGEFQSNTDITLPSALPFGKYEVRASAKNSKGEEVTCKSSFWIIPANVKSVDIHSVGTKDIMKPALASADRDKADFCHVYSNEVSDNTPAAIYFAPIENDAYIIYNVYSGSELVDSCEAVFDNDLHCISIPYKKKYGQGFLVSMMYVRNGHFYSVEKRFTYIKPDKKLDFSWSTFRDKLQPGQNEEWVLTVKDSKGAVVSDAELMAVLYDSALDRIKPHAWNFGIYFERFVPRIATNNTNNYSWSYINLYEHVSLPSHFVRSFDILPSYSAIEFYTSKPHFYHSMPLAAMGSRAAGMVYKERVVSDGSVMLNAIADSDDGVAEEAKPVPSNANEVPQQVEVDEHAFDNVSIRSDFSETAFFMPHLTSDKNGNVKIAFTVPESLTEWSFMTLAHTKDMHYGSKLDKIVTRKEFMVRPNMPRFVRWGDKASIASSIINQSDRTLEGTARMRMLSSATGEELLVSYLPFSVEAGKTARVEFSFDVLESYGDLDCEITAVCGNNSDGEKNHLPVLSTKREIVENVPFYIIGEGEKTLDLTKLFNSNAATATHRQLKLEYTDNPSWMCIEALRSIKLPENKDAVSFATSLYANYRISDLMKTFPLLEKYEDKADIDARIQTALSKLQELQKQNGSWGWFEGMDGNMYTTLLVCEQLVKLPSDMAGAMLEKGMSYLDKRQLDYYHEELRLKKKPTISDFDSHYLSITSMMPNRSISNELSKLHKIYLSQLEKDITSKTIYGVANAACIFNAYGRTKAAKKYVESLRQYTVTKPGLGRFYATDAAYYSWMDYKIPTHVSAMRALMSLDKNDDYLPEMQLWLLAQKQVQKWDNPINTINVADLLMHISPLETFHEAARPDLTLDGKSMNDFSIGTINTERNELEGREANLTLQGNVLVDVPEEEINDGVSSLTVAKHTPSVSWGTAQARFYEDIETLNSYATGELKLERKLYVERGGQWTELTGSSPLQVGEKVRVRQIITADRDMDFIRLNAEHPACFEPTRTRSGYQFFGSKGGYLSIHDDHLDLFFDTFTRGTATIDLEFYVNRTGTYKLGISTVECVYAKQFGAHTDGGVVTVK